jgi:hypothetical protein
VRHDLAGGQATCGRRQHDLVNARQPALPFAHDDRLEGAVPILGHLDGHRLDLGEHRLVRAPLRELREGCNFRSKVLTSGDASLAG